MSVDIPKLWLPTDERESHFSVPPIEELNRAWLARNPGNLLDLEERIFGVAQAPARMPELIICVDLCEVVRQSGLALLEMRGGTIDDMVVVPSTGQPDYGVVLNGWDKDEKGENIGKTEKEVADRAQHKKALYLEQLMHHDAVQPSPLHEAIAAFLRKWREAEAYIVANTSTLEGSELSTIRFLKKYYSGCFQGILFPRNHNGKSDTTKATALNGLIESLQNEFNTTTAPACVAIDDATHHAIDLDASGSTVFVPAYPWNASLENHSSIERVGQTLGHLTIGSFIAVDTHLQNRVPS